MKLKTYYWASKYLFTQNNLKNWFYKLIELELDIIHVSKVFTVMEEAVILISELKSI